MPPCSWQSTGVLDLPDPSAATSFVVSPLQRRQRPGPRLELAMWLTSKQPTAAAPCGVPRRCRCTARHLPAAERDQSGPALTCAENSGRGCSEVSTGHSVEHHPEAVKSPRPANWHRSCRFSGDVTRRFTAGAKILLVEDDRTSGTSSRCSSRRRAPR